MRRLVRSLVLARAAWRCEGEREMRTEPAPPLPLVGVVVLLSPRLILAQARRAHRQLSSTQQTHPTAFDASQRQPLPPAAPTPPVATLGALVLVRDTAKHHRHASHCTTPPLGAP